MKKWLVYLLLLSMPLCCAAIAEDSGCPHANTYEWIDGMVYEPWSSANHQVLYGVNVQCDDCGVKLDWYGEGYFQAHSYSGGVCEYCGYSQDNLPTQSELQREAFLRVTENPADILDKTAVVVHDGHVRANPSAAADIAGSVLPKEEYVILDFQVTDEDHVWLQIRYGAARSWVSASLVRISGAQTLKGDEDLYLGRTCTVKVSSGRGRLTPGTSGVVIDYVRHGETFTILDSQYVQDGTLWLQIKTANGPCWISSGLLNLH